MTSTLISTSTSTSKPACASFSTRSCPRLAAFASVLLLAGASAFGQMRPGGETPQSNPNAPASVDSMQAQQANAAGSMQDKAFLHNAMEGGMAEVQLGQLAVQKGSSDDVKQFGQKMVDDHTKLNDQIKPLAQQLGVNPPEQLSKKDRALHARLQSLSGAQFDNAYIEAMVKDHKKDLDDFKAEAQQTQNPQLQQAVQQGGQVIAQHLQMIEQIAQSHNLPAGKGKMSSSGQ